jgi:hypothetical protein
MFPYDSPIKKCNIVTVRETRACLINGGMTNSERFFRHTRQKITGILCVFQDFLTQSVGKRSAVWAF